MSIEVTWDDQLNDVIIYHFTDKWTWNEFLVAFEQYEVAMASSLNGRPYAVIGNLLQSQPLPPGSGVQHVYGVFKKYPTNWKMTVIVTPSNFVRTLLTVGKRLHPDTRDGFIAVNTLDEAHQAICERLPQLEPMG